MQYTCRRINAFVRIVLDGRSKKKVFFFIHIVIAFVDCLSHLCVSIICGDAP